jgi:hypothetical protein
MLNKNNMLHLLHRLSLMLVCLSLITIISNAQPDTSPTTDDSAISAQGGISMGFPAPLSASELAIRTGLSTQLQLPAPQVPIRVGVLDTGFGGFLELDRVVTVVNPSDDPANYDASPNRHGRNVLEVLATFAPHTDLYACAYEDFDSYSLCITLMIGSEVDIIVHSAGVPASPLDGSNRWAREVDRAARAGLLWVNAAGNFANGYIVDTFSDTNGDTMHEFRGVGIQQTLWIDPGDIDRGSGLVILSWDNTSTQAANAVDLDLHIVSSTQRDIASSTRLQEGLPTQEALETVRVPLGERFGIQIRSFTDLQEPVRMTLFVEYATLPTSGIGGSIVAPGDSLNALTVGALQGNIIAPYSSRGPVASGALKPDLVTFGEVTLASGEAFIGTSAAAPIAGAAAAAIWQANPSWTREQVLNFLRDDATQDDGQIPGPDTNYGRGFLFMPGDINAPVRPVPAPTPTVSPAPAAPQPGTRNACGPGVLPVRLNSGSDGIVRNRDDSKVNVRNGSSTSAARIDQLDPLETFRVLQGPICDSRFAWFQIEYGSGARGWIAEGMYDAEGAEFYFVEPVTGTSQRVDTADLRCNVYVQEDFEAGSRETWFTDPSGRQIASIVSGAYQLRIIDGSRSNQPVSWGSLQEVTLSGDFHIQAELYARDFDNADDRVGIWVDYVDANDFLGFALRSDGAVQIARFERGYEPIHDWFVTSAVNIGDDVSNVLEIIRKGLTYEVYVNNQFVLEQAIDEVRPGRVAFFGASWLTPTTYRLESIRICADR